MERMQFFWRCRDCNSQFDRTGGTLAEGDLCPICKSKNILRNTYCGECGKEIPEGHAAFDFDEEPKIIDGTEALEDVLCASCWHGV